MKTSDLWSEDREHFKWYESFGFDLGMGWTRLFSWTSDLAMRTLHVYLICKKRALKAPDWLENKYIARWIFNVAPVFSSLQYCCIPEGAISQKTVTQSLSTDFLKFGVIFFNCRYDSWLCFVAAQKCWSYFYETAKIQETRKVTSLFGLPHTNFPEHS